MTDEGFLTRAEVEHLAEKLDHVRDLEREMAIALTGQTRPQAAGGYSRHQKPGSRPPYPIHIADLLDELGNELSTTCRDIEETRGHRYDAGCTLVAMADWITEQRFALSFMENGVETFDCLCKIIDRCRAAMGHITEDWSAYKVDDARRQALTAYEIEHVAKRLGEQGWGLNRQRVDRLKKAKKIRPVEMELVTVGDEDEGGKDGKGKVRKVDRFWMGEVLDAHLKTPRRRA